MKLTRWHLLGEGWLQWVFNTFCLLFIVANSGQKAICQSLYVVFRFVHCLPLAHLSFVFPSSTVFIRVVWLKYFTCLIFISSLNFLLIHNFLKISSMDFLFIPNLFISSMAFLFIPKNCISSIHFLFIPKLLISSIHFLFIPNHVNPSMDSLRIPNLSRGLCISSMDFYLFTTFLKPLHLVVFVAQGLEFTSQSRILGSAWSIWELFAIIGGLNTTIYNATAT